MYNADDAVARVDSYIVSVSGGGDHVGERRLVRIESVARSAATASMLDANGAPAAGKGDGERVESRPSGRRRGRRGGRRRRAAGGSSSARSGDGSAKQD